MWQQYLIEPLNQSLIFFYHLLGGNLGLAIILFTVILRVILLPLNIPSIKAAVKQKALAPELKKLKEQYGKDAKGYAAAQMALMKKNGVNPLAGCLPQILQLVVLIALYQVFIKALARDNINPDFLYLNLAKPDQYLIMPILAGLGQFLTSKLMMPSVAKEEKVAEKAEDKKGDMMYNLQKQSLYFMPLMTVFIGLKLPSGLTLYWLVTTIFSLAQQVLLQKVYEPKIKSGEN